MRTFPNLVEIGLRAIDILQNEVTANDVAGAALINDMIAAREAQARAFQRIGATGPHALEVPRPLDVQIARCRFAPIRVIEPRTKVSDTLEFNPAKIRAGIAAGRYAVSDESLEPLLGSGGGSAEDWQGDRDCRHRLQRKVLGWIR